MSPLVESTSPSYRFVERRNSDRFPIMEEVRYRVVDRGGARQGTGMSVDMSRDGVLFTTDNPLPPGRVLEMSVNWPARLDGVCPLKLVVTGRVVRSTGPLAALRIERYQFKTRGRS
ncbi:MAG: PilZ domain-containing protein [Bryobacteraceae bacterium]